MDLKTHLIDGANFGQAASQYCYIPLFRSQLQDSDADTWFVGSLFLDEHVLIYNGGGKDVVSLSFATKNTTTLNKAKQDQELSDQKEQEAATAQSIQNQEEVDQLKSTVLSLQDKYEELETSLHEADNEIVTLRNETNGYSKLNNAQFQKHKQIGWEIEAIELNTTIVQARMEKLQKTLVNHTNQND